MSGLPTTHRNQCHDCGDIRWCCRDSKARAEREATAHENEACALLVDTLLGDGNHVSRLIRRRMEQTSGAPEPAKAVTGSAKGDSITVHGDTTPARGPEEAGTSHDCTCPSSWGEDYCSCSA